MQGSAPELEDLGLPPIPALGHAAFGDRPRKGLRWEPGAPWGACLRLGDDDLPAGPIMVEHGADMHIAGGTLG